MKKQILISICIMMSLYVQGQMMFGTDNSIRTSYLPSAAGYDNQIIASWLEYHAYLGQIKAGNSVIGMNWRLPLDVFQEETEIGIGPMIQYRDNEFWSETFFRFPIASRVKIGPKWYTSAGFTPALKIYGEPRELTREIYQDPTFLPTRERQTLFVMDIGWSLDYADQFYLDLGCQNILDKPFKGTTGPKVDEVPIWTLNSAYKFGKKKDPVHVRIGTTFEIGIAKEQKTIWLARPNIQLLFLDEHIWIKYTFIKNNSLATNEYAQRFLVGGGDMININFAYTVGNSQLYKHSQGNFELFIVWNFESDRSNANKHEAVPCSKTNIHQRKRGD